MYKKLIRRIISFVVVLTLLISPNTVNAAVLTEDSSTFQMEKHTMELDNNSKIEMEEDNEIRIVKYFANNIITQVAILQKMTGDIYYYDMSQCDAISSYSTDEDVFLPEIYTAKYNIQDFGQDNDEEKINTINKSAVYSTSDFSYLKSKIYDDLGQTYIRYLYGYTDSKQYEQNSWHFAAGTALSVVMAVMGFMTTIDPRISAIASAAGYLLSKLSTKEWIKEMFWVYKFKQTSPTPIEFVCSLQFTYEKQRRVEVNGDEGYWETFEKKSDISIELTRDDILTTPGLYW